MVEIPDGQSFGNAFPRMKVVEERSVVCVFKKDVDKVIDLEGVDVLNHVWVFETLMQFDFGLKVSTIVDRKRVQINLFTLPVSTRKPSGRFVIDISAPSKNFHCPTAFLHLAL